jgi:hypothetical protein
MPASLVARSIAASVLLHGALAAVCAAAPAARPDDAERVAAAQPDDDAALVVLHPALEFVWSPPPALSSCFGRGVLEAMADRGPSRWGQVVHLTHGSLGSWDEIDSLTPLRRGDEVYLYLVNELFDECAEAAGIAGAAPSVRYEVRARRGRDGAPAVSLSASFGPELDDRLRCCLTATGASLVRTLRPRDEVRFDGGPHGRGVTLVIRTISGEPVVARRRP